MGRSNCEVRENNQRFYVGTKSEMSDGNACMQWSDVPDFSEVGEHNYCRNPGKKQLQDWCFYTVNQGQRKIGRCNVVTCGEKQFF